MQLDGLYEMELEVIENAICMETIDTEETRTIKLFIPKLMPLSQLENAKDEITYINRGLLLNDPSTLPETVYKIQASNYIEVPLSSSSFYKTIIEKGTHVYVMIPNKNIRDMKVISL